MLFQTHTTVGVTAASEESSGSFHLAYMFILFLTVLVFLVAALALQSSVKGIGSSPQQLPRPARDPGGPPAAERALRSQPRCSTRPPPAQADSGPHSPESTWDRLASARDLATLASLPEPRLHTGIDLADVGLPRGAPELLAHLCPSLVAPADIEFAFAVREVLSTVRQQLSFNIVTLQGDPLSHIIVDELGPQPGIFLQNLDQTPLACVRTGRVHSLPTGWPEICRPSGELFATVLRSDLRPGTPYILQSRSGQRLFTFVGNFREKAVNIMNSRGHLVCTSKRCIIDSDPAPHYQVKVGPLTDAGLLLCSLLAIDKLEGGSHTR